MKFVDKIQARARKVRPIYKGGICPTENRGAKYLVSAPRQKGKLFMY